MRLSSTTLRIGPAILTLAGLVGAAVPVAVGAAPADARTVTYRGVRLTVPTDWPVVDLASHPRTCARVDRHAVYLGAPGPDAACPPRLGGRTETISLRPTTATDTRAEALRTGLPRAVPSTVDHGASWAVESAGVTMTVTYGTDPAALGPILSGATLTSAAKAGTVRPAPSVRPEAATAVPGTVRSYGFDACQAPTSATMDRWLASSRFTAVGVYIGGGDLGCPDQPNLNAAWVKRQTGRGWHVFPLYVGRQAPCSDEPFKITSPAAQGRQDADDAVSKAAGYGMAPGSIIVHDMEFYPSGGSCTTSVLTYLSAWTTELNAKHYRSGVYSSRSAAIDDLVAARPSGRYTMPGTIDFAAWDDKPTVSDPDIPGSYWSSHRMKQYQGGHNETHDKITINIDSDWMDIS